MKKIIAVTAGLLLAGSLASVASAEVTFTGDARERLMMHKNYTGDDQNNDYDNGRIRLNIHATTKGGAYADMRWILGYTSTSDFASPSTKYGQSSMNNFSLDWGYIGIPIGPVTVLAGKMPDNSSLFFRYDGRNEGVAATWSNKMTSVTGVFVKASEQSNIYPTVTSDIDWWALQLNQKFGGGWELFAYGIYQDNQGTYFTPASTVLTNAADDMDGFLGDVRIQGAAGPVKILAELAYVDKKVVGNDDSPWGGVVHAKMEFGPASVTGILGFGQNGYAPDTYGPANPVQDYGFLMMGGAMAGSTSYLADIGSVGSPITVMNIGSNLNENDTWFAGLIGDYKISKTIKLVGIVGYQDINDLGKFVELSGLVRFDVVDGAYIDLGGGYLHRDFDNPLTYDGAAYGLFTELGIKF